MRGRGAQGTDAVGENVPGTVELNACVFSVHMGIMPYMFGNQPAFNWRGYKLRKPFFYRVVYVASMNDDQDCDIFVRLSREGSAFSMYHADVFSASSKELLFRANAKGGLDPTMNLGEQIYKTFLGDPSLVSKVQSERGSFPKNSSAEEPSDGKK